MLNVGCCVCWCIQLQFQLQPRFMSSSSSSRRTPSMATYAFGKQQQEQQRRRNEEVFSVGQWYSVPELTLRDMTFKVPLDYKAPHGHQIQVFAREVVAPGKEEEEEEEGDADDAADNKHKRKHGMPYLLYLQGGPGFESPRPEEGSGWIMKACQDGYRVILLDQRGTGLSTPLTVSSLAQFASAEEQADCLQHFRADNIVNDAEFIRVRIVPNQEPWTVLGQSYGGFCVVTYLSFAPQGLKRSLVTGGLPPLGNRCSADTVYRACYPQVVSQNKKFYERFPHDREIVQELVLHLVESEGMDVVLPSGSLLTPRSLQLLGLSALGSGNGFERLHYLLERVWDPILVQGRKKQISYNFKRMFENWIAFHTNPLFAILHETIYCQGDASKWSAEKIRHEFDNTFDAVKAAKEGQPVYFTGEMVFPWMFDEISTLRPFKEVAHLLAEKKDWPQLYDLEMLKKNQVPVAAAVYYEDMYVNNQISLATASQISGIRLWITNEYRHSGLRDNGSKVYDYLMGLLNGKKPTF